MPRFDEIQASDEGKSFLTHVNSIALCSSTWILDSGATNHIVCSLDFIVNYRMANGAAVNLPTGQCINVEHIGDVKLNNTLWLKEALHIPSFKFNIISVSKLIQDSSYKLIFMDGQCLIQQNGLMAGLARQERGLYRLYVLMDPPTFPDTSQNMQCNSVKLWHQRLRHFPTNKLHMLTDINVPNTKHWACDVCHLAKQKRSPFPLSVTTSKACFDLIHIDIWGAFLVCALNGEHYFLTIVDDFYGILGCI